jgi:hypothetical protein
MTGNGDIGQVAPLGGRPPGDDLGDLKVKRGAGPVVAVLLLLVAIGGIGAAVWYFAFKEDPAFVHENFRTQIFGTVHNQYYDPFWTCALGGQPLSNFKNNTELVARIQLPAKQGSAVAKLNAERIKSSDNCLPLLAKAIPEYRAINTNPETPAEYQPMIEELATNLEGIQTAWTEYADFHAVSADREEFRERILKRGADWIRYVEKTRDKAVRDLTDVQKTNGAAYCNFVQCVLGDTPYTSFVTEGDELETSAQYKVADHLELACDNGGAAYIAKLQACRVSLFSADGNEVTKAIDEAAAHWAKQDLDTQSGAPIFECLERNEESQGKAVAVNIAKAWYDFTKSYNKLYEYSREKSGSPFGRNSARSNP